MKQRTPANMNAFAAVERDAKLREFAGDGAPAPTSLALHAKPLTAFDRQFSAALLACNGHVADAYRMVCEIELPDPGEIKRLRERGAMLTLDEMTARKYDDPELHRASIVAVLVDKALNALEDSTQIAAAAQLARMMPGWIAPTRKDTNVVTGKLTDIIKELALRNHEPGEAAVVTER